ncbi:MAG: hypothetical protein JST93_12370 [Acidobacteria bacterium]|nr:hypothetical protein [Acidobacteriota bacterium]
MSITAVAGPVLYTIGGDANGVPNQLVRIDTDAQSYSTVGTLGSGSTSYAGGIQALSATDFAGFENDANGQASIAFYSVSALLTALPVGVFQPGGLVFEPVSQSLYWIENLATGDWQLTAQTVPVLLRTGESGNGLTFDPVAQHLYAIVNDAVGNSRLLGIDPLTATVTSDVALGTGFYGGVAWDPGTNRFYMIQSGTQGEGTLYSYVPGDPSGPSALFSIGNQGFQFAALTVGVDETGVPEPSSWQLIFTSLVFSITRSLAAQPHQAAEERKARGHGVKK